MIGFLFSPLNLAMLAFCIQPAQAESGQANILVAPEHLPGLLSRDPQQLMLLDCRTRAEYDAGQLENAQWLDAAAWKQASLATGGLDKPDVWRQRAASLGVTPDAFVVVYDDGSMTEASRIWFILQFAGIERAAVLDGGFSAARPLIEGGRLRLMHRKAAPSSNRPATAPASPAVCRVNRAEKLDVLNAKGRRGTVVLDVRTAAEYQGVDHEKNPRHGHIPGAVNIPHARLFQSETIASSTQPTGKPKGRLKSRDELRRLFTEAGLTPDQRIITHCQSGGRAALGAIALIHAGYGKVENYYSSFAEWAADADMPVVTSGPSGTSHPASSD